MNPARASLFRALPRAGRMAAVRASPVANIAPSAGRRFLTTPTTPNLASVSNVTVKREEVREVDVGSEETVLADKNEDGEGE